MQAKLSVESKLERAEHKLIDGVIDDQSFERLKKTYREQIEDFENQIAKLDRSKNIKVDVIQQVLALTRDIGTSYSNAKPELKQLYLGLSWHHFLAKEKKIVEAVKSPIVVALEEVGAITDTTGDATKTPIPSPIQGMDSSVINNTFRGRGSLIYLTTLYDQEYMAGIREKLKFIADMQAEQTSEALVTA